MADISRIQLPSGNTYDIKDATAREMLAGGVSFNVVWTTTNYASTSAPSAATLADIPAGVVVYYNNGASSATGTLAASADTKGKFYLIYSKTQVDTLDVFDEYVTVGESTYAWEKIGDTQISLANVVTGVSITTNSASFVTGYASPTSTSVVKGDASFSVTQPTISVTPTTTYLKATATGAAVGADGTATVVTDFASPTTKQAIGSSATFSFTQPTISVTPSTTYLGATATGAAVGADGTATVITDFASPATDTFVKSVSAETGKNLVTTTVPNVTSAGTAASWTFTMGSGDNAETLIIGGGNGTAPTLGNAITVATGATSSTGSGVAVVTGVTVGDSASAITGFGTPSTATVLTGVKVTAQPTISLATNAATATGRVQVTTGISSATATGGAVAWNSKDTVTAITGLGTPSTETVLTGVKVTTQPTISLGTSNATATGYVQVATGISSATASGAAVALSGAATVDVLTGLGTPSTSSALTSATLTVTKGNQ